MPLSIEYKKVEAGWIEIVLHSENSSYDIDISEVYDPFEDWFYALERVYRSDPPSIIINPEGKTYRIDIIGMFSEKYCLRIFHHNDNIEVFSCTTTREEIIEQMYGKLMEFVRGDKYDPNEYEIHYSGFPLKHYRNETLERYLQGKVFDNSISLTKCRSCEHQIEVQTIDDMLQRAYEIIERNPKVIELLNNLKLDKYSIGVTQEYTRFKMLSDPYVDFIRDYRCIQEGEGGIYLGFNENFTVLEVIEISTRFFRDNHIRGYKAEFNNLSNEQKIEFLDNIFSCYDTKLSGLSSYVEVKYIESIISTEIILKMPNNRVVDNKAYAFYPDSNEYPYFIFDIDHEHKDGRLRSIKLELARSEPINEPVSKWLHQTVVDMYPDYGGCFLWFDGACGCLESIEGYELEGSELAQKLEDWQGLFEGSFLRTDIDWVEFDKVGRELFVELRDVIKKDYILTYSKSYEETCGTHAEQEAME